jgi:hypothetical protein
MTPVYHEKNPKDNPKQEKNSPVGNASSTAIH